MVMSGSGERIVFVHARPGDESALTGGTIARLRVDGSHVTVLYSTPLTEADAAAASAALAELGARSWQGLPHSVDGIDGIDGARQEIARALREAIAELGATAVVVGAVDEELREAATRAAREAGLPLFLARTVRQSPGQRLIAIDVGDHLDQKLRALRNFPTRWILTERIRTLADGTIDTVTDTETFLRADAPRSVPASLAPAARPPALLVPEPARLTLANRSLAGLGGLLVGILFGVLGTIAHQATVTLFGVALPIGLTIAFVGIGALLLGLRLIVGDRFVVGLAAAGLLVTIFVLSLRGSGGSVLVPAGLPGTLWTVVPALIAALVLAWPKVPKRRR
jgi:LmbE family N-acetylglucosaminyl deacetylase